MGGANMVSRPNDLPRIQQDALWLTRRARRAQETVTFSRHLRHIIYAERIFFPRCDQLLEVVARQDRRAWSDIGVSAPFGDEDIRMYLLGEIRLFKEWRVGREWGKYMPPRQGAQPDNRATQTVGRDKQYVACS